MCNFSQPQKQTDLQTHNDWITFTSFHFLWTLKRIYSIQRHTQHICTLYSTMYIQLFFSFCTNESRLWPPTSTSSSHLIYSMAMDLYFTKLLSFFLSLSVLQCRKSLSIKHLYYICRSVGWLVDRPYHFVLTFAPFTPPVCNIYTDFIYKSKSNYTAKISPPFPKLNRFDSISHSQRVLKKIQNTIEKLIL